MVHALSLPEDYRPPQSSELSRSGNLPLLNAAAATALVRKMVKREQRGRGDLIPAMKRLARRCRVGFWTLSHLRKGNAKTVDVSIFARLRDGYLDLCEQQIAELQHDISITRRATPDVAFDDLEQAASDLAARLADARNPSRDEHAGAADRRHPDRPGSVDPGRFLPAANN